MKLISTTLTGNREDTIGDALRSVVEWVDVCLVIDTGVTDRSLEVAREVAKEKYVEKKFPWVDDFAAARNFALEAAHALGGTWAMSLDTDERIVRSGEDVRSFLEMATVDCVVVMHGSETHVRERIFRLPAKHRFYGPIHETYPGGDSFAALRQTLCVELPKTPEQLTQKAVRDLAVLVPYAKEHPSDPRWLYYIGDSLQILSQLEPAIQAYLDCARLRGWDEESAWACYRAAECCMQLGRYRDALDACGAGMVRHPGMAELPRLAGYVCLRTGDMAAAAWWAWMAASMGLFEGHGATVGRVGFRDLSALYEGPYDVLRLAMAALGDAVGAREAEQKYHAAVAARERAEATRQEETRRAIGRERR